MIKIKNILQVALGAAVLLSVSCKREGFSGPEIVAADSNFKIVDSLKSTQPSVSFSNFSLNPTVGFSAKFNQKVSWELTINGLGSGAAKVYSGTSDGFKDDEIVWDGRATGVPFFRPDEDVSVYLVVLGRIDTLTIDSMETEKAFTYHDKTINGVKNIVVDDFENGTGTGGSYSAISVGSGVSPDQADTDIEFAFQQDKVVEGNWGYKMQGMDVNNNGWSGGMNSQNLVDFYMKSDIQQLLIDSGVNPEDLFFNMYIYGAGKPNTSVQFKVYEDDSKSYIDTTSGSPIELPIASREDLRLSIFNPAAKDIPKEVYRQDINDGWIYDIEVSWVGWKLVSVSYAQFRAANELITGGNGDRIKESWRICGMAISLLSFPTTGVLTETYIDHLVITEGGRFQQ